MLGRTLPLWNIEAAEETSHVTTFSLATFAFRWHEWMALSVLTRPTKNSQLMDMTWGRLSLLYTCSYVSTFDVLFLVGKKRNSTVAAATIIVIICGGA